MRYFELLNFQHVVLYVFPTITFMLVFAVGLGFSHFHTKDAEARKKKITHHFPAGLAERDAPFPLVMTLIIVGTVLWMFFYILGIGLQGVII